MIISLVLISGNNVMISSESSKAVTRSTLI
jgi:hypothetical protein